MSAYPKISLVVHCFNRDSYLAATLDSILDQGYPNLELIVIDDGSTDGSWDIIRGYEERLAYVERLEGKRTSPVEALNVGFSHATGEIFGWLNTKNVLLEKSLFVVGDVFRSQPDVRWLSGQNATLDAEGRVLRVNSSGRKTVYDYLVGNSETIQQESTFWRRSLWAEAGGRLDPARPWSFDTALWAEFFRHAVLFHIETIIGAYRKIPQGQSVARRSELMGYIQDVLRDLRASVPWTVSVSAGLYRALRAFKPFFAAIPNAWYVRLPILRRYAYRMVAYSYEGNDWKTRLFRMNPFKV